MMIDTLFIPRGASAARIAPAILCALLASCASQAGKSPEGVGGAASASATRPANCTPLETRPTEAAGEKPASPDQTRACGVTSNVTFDVVVVAKGLEKPWSVEPLPGGDLLVTEKPGRLRIVSASGQIGAPIAGVPAVDPKGQGGLLDVALSPSFASDRTIFWTFSEPRDGGNGTSIARGVLSADRTRLDDVRVIFRVLPTYAGQQHYGSRIAFGRDGMLYASFGERSQTEMRPFAQRLDSHLGKTIRIRPDGTVPPDNPFVGRADAKPEIWALGHRNPEALTFDARGQLWDVEHGTRGGDELNLIQKGKNYGWPLQAYGEEYSGKLPISSAIGDASPVRAGMEQPTYYWDPVIAPSGSQFYSGNAFPAWKGNLFIGALKEMRLVRLVFDGNRVVGEEHLLTDRKQRIRDVRQGPDGLLYLVTDQDAGELLKLVPRR
ncbi:MAG TPA: PQQ-dependent sugar dehydrogenase [Gemmatimonadaceae bacterium]|nr:PQQ-dependent sugar dehydrogenase [Gemmatimonadaceae bacterium]